MTNYEGIKFIFFSYSENYLSLMVMDIVVVTSEWVIF